MEIFRDVKVQWMKYKWIYLIFSWTIIIIGWFTVFHRGGFLFSIDLKGGTIITIKFAHTPEIEKIRQILKENLNVYEVNRFDRENKNQIQAKLKLVRSEEASEFQKLNEKLYGTLKNFFDADKPTRLKDLNRVGTKEFATALRNSRVLENMGILKPDASIEQTEKLYNQQADAVIKYRTDNGMIRNIDELASLPGMQKPLFDFIKRSCYASSFSILGIESVGPKVGKELQGKAVLIVLVSLGFMLLYIAFRFKLAYGVGATIASIHDVLITLGLLSLFGKEISLTVIAALLTLIGYSTNDTIVVFDRIRENIKKSEERGHLFQHTIERAINQTLSRTIITSGLTFVSVFCLWLFGGESLNGFSFVLVVGIVIGTYSSIAIASPIMYWWIKYLSKEKEKRYLKFA